MDDISANQKALIMRIVKAICDKTRLSVFDFHKPKYEQTGNPDILNWTLSLKNDKENYFKFTITGNKATVEKFPVLNKTTSHKFIIETIAPNSAITDNLILHAIAWVNGISKIRELSIEWDNLFGTDQKSSDENINRDSSPDIPLEEEEVENIRLLLNNLNSLISESKELNDEIKEQSKKLNNEINEKLDNKPTSKTKQYIGQIILEFIKQSLFNPAFREEISRIVYEAMDSVTNYSRELANPIIALLSDKL